MRLCLVTDSLIPSGVGEHMLALARELAPAFDVMLAADPRSGLARRALDAGIAALAFDAEAPASLLDALRRWRADVLHVHAGVGWEGHELAALGREAGIGAVMRTEHLPFVLTDEEQTARYLDAVHDVSAVVCVSQAAADSFVAAGVRPERVHAIRNGIHPRTALKTRDEMRDALGLAPDAPVLLVVARLTEQKGHGFLLDALSLLRARFPDLACLAVGGGPLRDALEAQTDALGLGATVRFLGNRDDVADLMACADLLVLPSLFEGLHWSFSKRWRRGSPWSRRVSAARARLSSTAVPDGLPSRATSRRSRRRSPRPLRMPRCGCASVRPDANISTKAFTPPAWRRRPPPSTAGSPHPHKTQSRTQT